MSDKKTNQEPFYDEYDAVRFIVSDTGISECVIRSVLNSELRYMKSVGIIDWDVDEYLKEIYSNEP